MLPETRLVPENPSSRTSQDKLPFGALPGSNPEGARKKRPTRRKKRPTRDGADAEARSKQDSSAGQAGGEERGDGKKRRRRRRRGKPASGEAEARRGADGDGGSDRPVREPSDRDRGPAAKGGQGNRGRKGPRPNRRSAGTQRDERGAERNDESPIPSEGVGMFVLDKGNIGQLRLEANQFLPSKDDIFVAKRLIQLHRLRDGMLVRGRLTRGQKQKYQLADVIDVDGKDPKEWRNKTVFKDLTSIDPDFHYQVGDVTGDVSMRIVDLLSPIGRGQRGLLVAPPRSGKTTIMRSFAKGIEEGYPEVHLFVLLVDERPEEATDWKRSVTNGKVFVSTSDENTKRHIQLAEAVWMRCMRLVEMGEDVVLLMDSITRLARAYNNNSAGSGRTMSGGLDSRAMERPRKIFGSARNTVEAGSLTILGTTLVHTGSRMDQLVFEEFKGTGNMELVLDRRLADRRIFPAIDVEKTGTRKEEKLVGMRRLKQIHILRRVLARLHWADAMDTLITRLSDVEKTDDFLKRFEVDPDA